MFTFLSLIWRIGWGCVKCSDRLTGPWFVSVSELLYLASLLNFCIRLLYWASVSVPVSVSASVSDQWTEASERESSQRETASLTADSDELEMESGLGNWHLRGIGLHDERSSRRSVSSVCLTGMSLQCVSLKYVLPVSLSNMPLQYVTSVCLTGRPLCCLSSMASPRVLQICISMNAIECVRRHHRHFVSHIDHISNQAEPTFRSLTLPIGSARQPAYQPNRYLLDSANCFSSAPDEPANRLTAHPLSTVPTLGD